MRSRMWCVAGVVAGFDATVDLSNYGGHLLILPGAYGPAAPQR